MIESGSDPAITWFVPRFLLDLKNEKNYDDSCTKWSHLAGTQFQGRHLHRRDGTRQFMFLVETGYPEALNSKGG